MPAVREVTVALPAHGEDIYRRHQLVWTVMHGRAGSGGDFVFAMLSPRIALLRSSRFDRGVLTVPREGRLAVSLVAVSRMQDGDRAITDAMAPAFVTDLMGQHGIVVDLVSISPPREAVGIKQRQGTRHRIALPIRDVLMDARIADPLLAEIAWRSGIGRGKRFGYGMLRHVAH